MADPNDPMSSGLDPAVAKAMQDMANNSQSMGKSMKDVVDAINQMTKSLKDVASLQDKIDKSVKDQAGDHQKNADQVAKLAEKQAAVNVAIAQTVFTAKEL